MIYHRSRRLFPARLPPPIYSGHYLTHYLRTNGGIRLNRVNITLAPTIVREYIGLDEVEDGIWAVYFYGFELDHLNERDRHIQGVHGRRPAARSET